MPRSGVALSCLVHLMLHLSSADLSAFAWTPPSVGASPKTAWSSACTVGISRRPDTRLFRYRKAESYEDSERRRKKPQSPSGGGVRNDGEEESGRGRAAAALRRLRRARESEAEDWAGAGSPRPELEPGDIPSLLMKALERNDFPEIDAGLSAMWEFAGGNTKFVFQNNVTEFVESAHETADTLPTSFYGVAMNGRSWEMETEVNRVGGEDGWIATQVMKTVTSDGRVRRWQWELRKNRRPPCLGCWMVESIGSSDRKGRFEPE